MLSHGQQLWFRMPGVILFICMYLLTSKRSTVITGQTEGFKVADGWVDGWVVCEVWADRWVEGEGGWPEGWMVGRCVRYGRIGG